MYKRHLQLLSLLLEATRNGRASWRRGNAESLQTRLAGLVCALQFRHPLLAGEESPEADAVEVTIGTASVRFYTGSEAFDLVREIFAAADPRVAERDQRELEQLDGLIRRIRRESET